MGLNTVSLAGGAANQVPFQTAQGTTDFIPNGTSNQVLQSQGNNAAPVWTDNTPYAQIFMLMGA